MPDWFRCRSHLDWRDLLAEAGIDVVPVCEDPGQHRLFYTVCVQFSGAARGRQVQVGRRQFRRVPRMGDRPSRASKVTTADPPPLRLFGRRGRKWLIHGCTTCRPWATTGALHSSIRWMHSGGRLMTDNSSCSPARRPDRADCGGHRRRDAGHGVRSARFRGFRSHRRAAACRHPDRSLDQRHH